MEVHTFPFATAAPNDVAAVVASIGSDQFGWLLLGYLHELCGADHLSAFQIDEDDLTRIVSSSLDGSDSALQMGSRYVLQQFWRKDPLMYAARRHVKEGGGSILRISVDRLPDRELRDKIYPQILERLILVGHGPEATFGISMLRSNSAGKFSNSDLQRLGETGCLLLSLLEKHSNLGRRAPIQSAALRSIAVIEQCIAGTSLLSAREVEVTSRSLFGVSTLGISLDLGIGTETVKTHRKRAYQRLHISCLRELLTWYFTRWDEWNSPAMLHLH